MAKKGPTVHLTDLGGSETASQLADHAGLHETPDLSLLTPTKMRALAQRVGLEMAIVETKPPAAWPVYLVASGAAAITALTPIFYVAGYAGGLQPLVQTHFMLAMVAIWAALPAIVVLLAAYMLQQGRRLAAEAQNSRRLAHQLLAPTAQAAAEAGDMAELLRAQILEAGEAANLARDRLAGLREALIEETTRLNEGSATAARTAGDLAQKLGHERAEMASLGQTLDAQSAKVADTIGRQAQMVAEASDLAEAQLREAEAVLAARAADLAAAAGEASDAARVAGDDLGRQVGRLETAGMGVGDQMRLVSQTITDQRAALVTAAHALRAEQEDFALAAETRGAQLSEFMVQARLGAVEVGDSAGRGAQALSELIDTARQKLGEFSETAEVERGAVAAEAHAQLLALGNVLEDQRRRLQAEFSSLSSDADQAFASRMNQARDLVEGSAVAIEQAGAVALQRLDSGIVEARKALVDMQRLLANIDERAARLPQEAQGNLAQIRAAVGEGIDELLSQARRAAQETQSIDQAFQERVKRNYDMLSEAVKLMGAATEGSRLAAPLPTELTRPEPEVPLRGRLRFSSSSESAQDPLEGLAEQAPARPASGGAANPAAKPAARTGEDWSWNEMISGLEREETDLGPELVVQVRAMGIEPDALLPKSRVEDIASALSRRDESAARDGVRKLAPAAIRRLVRRLFSDADLKAKTDRFLFQYRAAIDDAAGQHGGVVVVASLLTSEVGRCYLLLDAASGDLT